jgi:serine/threonine-protein kinase HipA
MMRSARVYMKGIFAGVLEELMEGKYRFSYQADYKGAPISLTMPLKNQRYAFDKFPPFFEGVLPEGTMLDALLRKYKLDKNDYFSQLIVVGGDLVGAVTVEEIV